MATHDALVTRETGMSIVPPFNGHEHESTMIFLHGFGETVETSWVPIIKGLSPKVPGIKWILPQAPLIPSSYNNGALFPAWFDTPTLNFLDPPNDDVPNQDRAVQYLLSLIQAELASGLPAKKIYIGGYSQGATIALRTALVGISRLRGDTLGGVVVLKGWMARGETIAQDVKEGCVNTPIFWAAATQDEVVTPSITNSSLAVMAGLGFGITLFADEVAVDPGVVFQYNPGQGHEKRSIELDQMITWFQAAVESNERSG